MKCSIAICFGYVHFDVRLARISGATGSPYCCLSSPSLVKMVWHGSRVTFVLRMNIRTKGPLSPISAHAGGLFTNTKDLGHGEERTYGAKSSSLPGRWGMIIDTRSDPHTMLNSITMCTLHAYQSSFYHSRDDRAPTKIIRSVHYDEQVYKKPIT